MPEQPYTRTHWPPLLLHHLAQALPRLPAVVPAEAARSLPAASGSYLLLLRLAAALSLSGRFAGATLPAGIYLYAGSARGPGGLRARLTHHMRRHKALRWHVDQITAAAITAALPFPDAGDHTMRECRLAAALCHHAAFTVPLPGFGSSDCRTCPAHLLRWQPDPATAA